jgi:hypothetical protein
MELAHVATDDAAIDQRSIYQTGAGANSCASATSGIHRLALRPARDCLIW